MGAARHFKINEERDRTGAEDGCVMTGELVGTGRQTDVQQREGKSSVSLQVVQIIEVGWLDAPGRS